MLVGCNLAHEIANNHFCEGTVGCRDQKYMRILQDLFKSDTFRVTVTDDADCVEICSTLRVSCGCIERKRGSPLIDLSCLSRTLWPSLLDCRTAWI